MLLGQLARAPASCCVASSRRRTFCWGSLPSAVARMPSPPAGQVRVSRTSSMSSFWSCAPCAGRVDGEVARDAEHPGGEARLALEVGEVGMDPHECLLGDIPGEVAVFDDAERHGVHLPLVADDERAECLGLTGLGSRNQREVVSFHADGCAGGEIHRGVELYHSRSPPSSSLQSRGRWRSRMPTSRGSSTGLGAGRGGSSSRRPRRAGFRPCSRSSSRVRRSSGPVSGARGPPSDRAPSPPPRSPRCPHSPGGRWRSCGAPPHPYRWRGAWALRCRSSGATSSPRSSWKRTTRRSSDPAGTAWPSSTRTSPGRRCARRTSTSGRSSPRGRRCGRRPSWAPSRS